MQSVSGQTVKARTGVARAVPRSRSQGGRALAALKLYQEGILTGICGAAALTLWFLLRDVLAGHPLYTLNVLSTAFFKGGQGLVPPTHVDLSLSMLVPFTSIYWLAFILMGVLASRLLSLAEHNPNLGFGVLLLFVLFEGGFLGGAMMFAEPVLHALAWQSVLVGNLFAAVAMGGYLWRQHPHMVIYP